ncbi:PA2169 family four-helix-bundle protein [Flavobacteriaceae bacterium KMM 6897]|nr:PA2169 family four-helix-bundle protein [Flavobacteriaceae bacterium KMM 6897]
MKRENMKYSEKISNRLNNLLEKTYDAEKGLKLAQDKIDNSTTIKYLNDRAEQKAEFGHELKKEILQFGELPENDGTLKGGIHRVWMDLRTMVASDENENLLEEVERGDKASLEEYNEILKDAETVSPPSTQSMLVHQRDVIESSLTEAKIHEQMV